jgi:hypothetical protein
MTGSRKLLGVIAGVAGMYLTATTAMAEPLLAKNGRPACGNVKTKGGNKVATRAMRVQWRDDLQKQLEGALGDPEHVATLQSLIDHQDACIADIDLQVALATSFAPAAPAPVKVEPPKVQARRAVVRR